jgi:hypothetical protein
MTNIQSYLGGINLGDTSLTGSVPMRVCELVTSGLLVQIDCGEVACSCGCECWVNTTDDLYYIGP